MADYELLLNKIQELEKQVQQLNENIHRLYWPKLCYVPGSGGNWLRRIVIKEPLQSGSANFHRDCNGNLGRFGHLSSSLGKLVPGVDLIHHYTSHHDYFFSGTCYFNFYLNKLYKFDQIENKFFDQFHYTKWVNKCLHTAQWIFDFEKHIDHCNINFVDLVHDPKEFLQQANQICNQISVPVLTSDEFLPLRAQFLETCVNPDSVYENWNNMFWVLFVVAELELRGITPQDFAVNDPNEVQNLISFAKNNYHACTLKHVVPISSNVCMPEWPAIVDNV